MAGDQTPVIPSFDDCGKSNIASPSQYGPTWVKVGVRLFIEEETTTVCVIGFVHAPASSTVTS